MGLIEDPAENWNDDDGLDEAIARAHEIADTSLDWRDWRVLRALEAAKHAKEHPAPVFDPTMLDGIEPPSAH